MRLYGLIGYPLTHSFSKKYFEEKFIREGLTNCRFENFSIQSIDELTQKIIPDNPELKGLAVTIPYKQSVIPFLHSKKGLPDGLDACNCIRIEEGKLYGYNTDYIGFSESFKSELQPHHTRALVLGNGGATAAVVFALRQMGLDYKIVSRRLHSGSHLVYDDITSEIIKDFPVIINTTPLGMHPQIDTCPSIPYNAITSKHYLYDLVYNPSETLFLKKGKAQGAIIKNGADMLLIQAEENWKIWNGGI